MAENPSLLISLSHEDQSLADLRASAPEAKIRITTHLEAPGQTLPAAMMKGSDVFLCEFLPTNFDDFDQLKWIQLSSAGYAQVLDLPILQRGIRVTNGLGNFDIAIAEWNVMMMLMCHRHVPEMMDNQRQAVWDRSAKFQAELREMTVGFYGYGGIARQTARLCRSMGLNVWTLTRDGRVKKRENIYLVEGTGDPDGVMCDRVFSPQDKDEFFGGVDFLIMAMPITPTTTGIIGETELRLLKPSAVFINPGISGALADDIVVFSTLLFSCCGLDEDNESECFCF